MKNAKLSEVRKKLIREGKIKPYIRTSEHKKLMSERLIGRKFTKEHCENIRKSLRGNVKLLGNQNWKFRDQEKATEKMKKTMQSQEMRKQAQLKSIGVWKNPEYRKKYLEAFKRRPNPSPETNGKRSDTLKRKYKLGLLTSPSLGKKFSDEINKRKGHIGNLNAMSRPEIKLKQSMACRTYGKQWKGGVSKLPYSFDFDSKLKKKILQRDNYTCQLCSEIISKNSKNKFLCIHHIDYNKKNSNEKNLITLCNFCNSSVNFSREQWKEYFNTKIQGGSKCEQKTIVA